MATLPTNRSTSNTVAEHISDHNELHRLHNDLDGHLAAADPHTGYQKESEKGAASGYASLDSSTKVPTTQLGGAGATSSLFLRGDQTWADPGHWYAAGGGRTQTVSNSAPSSPVTNDVWIAPPLFARKTADTTRTATVTRTADPHLTLAVEASGVYMVRTMLLVTSVEAADFSFKFTGPTGATMDWVPMVPGNVTGAASVGSTKWPALTIADDVTATIGTDKVGWVTQGLLVVSTTAGNFTVDWAQATSDAGNTTLHSGSFLYLDKVA